MIKNKMIILDSILAGIGILINQYNISDISTYKKPQKEILDLDKTIFEMYQKQYNIVNSQNTYWGIKDGIEILSDIKDLNITTKLTLVTKDKNLLCIEKSCYRLVGIHQDKGLFSVSLYNKDLKHQIKTYVKKEKLELNIIISDIKQHKVEFLDINSSRKWDFKIFDVNQTKYKPKDIAQ